MASSIRLTNTGAPDTPPVGYARIYIEEYKGKLHLKMKRPDGTVEIFGTLDLPLGIEHGGTGITDTPEIGQLLIGTGTGYRIGDITAGPGISITKNASTFQISTDISNIELVMPSEFDVSEQSVNGNNQFLVTKTNQDPNKIYAGPSSGNASIPVFRLLTASDIPELSKNKITGFQEEVQNILAFTIEDSSTILFQYNDIDNKIKAFLSETGVTPGTYGSTTSIPSIQVDAQGRIISVSSITAYFLSEQITDIKEKIEDVVGDLVKDTDSIDAQYNDVLSTLELHVKTEYLITTNISESENTRAPTSQSIKLYVDELVDAERTSRIAEDSELSSAISTLEQQVGTNLQQVINNLTTDLQTEIDARIAGDSEITERLDAFFLNAPELLDSIQEIETRFNEVELAIVTSNSNNIQTQQELSAALDVLSADIQGEIETRITEIDRVYNAIQSHRERIDLTPQMLTQSIELQQVQQLSHIMPNSVVAFIDRLGIFEELDFVLANGSNNKVVLNFTNEILDILDGTEVLRITYLTKI